jgi:hypothetical protein
MKVSELIEALQSYPPDAIVTAFDPDGECTVAITGLLYDPEGSYTALHEDGESAREVRAATVDIQTDE